MFCNNRIEASRTWMRRLGRLSALGLSLNAVACSADVGDGDPVEPAEAETSTKQDELAQDLLSQPFTSATNYQVNVCFRHQPAQVFGFTPSDLERVLAKESVRTAVEKTWGAVTRLRFLGWNDCVDPVNNQWMPIMLRYQNNDNVGGVATYGVGGRLPEDENAGDSQIRLDVARYRSGLGGISIHEMGHALGFVHEHQRVDAQRCSGSGHTNVSCTSNANCSHLFEEHNPATDDDDVHYVCDLEAAPGSSGYRKCIVDNPNLTTIPGWTVKRVTPYDPDSVMNYCGPADPNAAADQIRDLTPWDVYGIQEIYGKRTTAFRQLVTGYHAGNQDFATMDSDNEFFDYPLRYADGWVYAAPAPGTVSVELWANYLRSDYAIVATAATRTELYNAGYRLVRILGYAYSAAQLDPANNQPITVPLKLYFNSARFDRFTAASTAGQQFAQANSYAFVRDEVHVFPKLPYTVLWGEKSSGFRDYVVTSRREVVGGLRYYGYEKQGYDGLVMRYPVAGTAPLKQFRKSSGFDFDYLATATATGEASALLSQYTFEGVEGHVFTAAFGANTPGPTSPVDMWFHAQDQDAYTTVQRPPAAGSNYTRVRTEGHAFNAGQ